jgi:hypothetical protein
MSSQGSTSSGQATQFTFVTENNQSEARSHAMREHWKKRHKTKQDVKSHRRKPSRTLLPRFERNGDATLPQEDFIDCSPESRQDNSDEIRENNPNVPAQLLHGFRGALSTTRPDPFQTCPVRLTSKHQKLLHHCLFEPIDPMRKMKDCLLNFRDKHPCDNDVRRTGLQQIQPDERCLVSLGSFKRFIFQLRHGTFCCPPRSPVCWRCPTAGYKIL